MIYAGWVFSFTRQSGSGGSPNQAASCSAPQRQLHYEIVCAFTRMYAGAPISFESMIFAFAAGPIYLSLYISKTSRVLNNPCRLEQQAQKGEPQRRPRPPCDWCGRVRHSISGGCQVCETCRAVYYCSQGLPACCMGWRALGCVRTSHEDALAVRRVRPHRRRCRVSMCMSGSGAGEHG